MNIEIHQPELETLIQERMASGRFRDVEDILLQALKCAEPTDEQFAIVKPQKSLKDVFAKARALLEGEELEIERDPSPGREIDLS